MIDTRAFGCRDGTNNRFATPVFWREPPVLELFFHPVDICSRKINLVERDHDLHMRRGLGVINCFDRLRHDAVIGRDNEHDNVRYIGPTRAHRSESGVTWCIDKGNFRSVASDAIGADVLGDPASLAGRHLRLANRVQERGLAVIDMSHERDNGRTRL